MPKVTVMPEGISVTLTADETILDGLYRRGYAFRTGCRRGGCAICMVDLLEGEVAYTRPIAAKVLDDDKRAQGQCLSCRAVPMQDVVIALREGSFRCVNPLMARFAGNPSAS